MILHSCETCSGTIVLNTSPLSQSNIPLSKYEKYGLNCHVVLVKFFVLFKNMCW